MPSNEIRKQICVARTVTGTSGRFYQKHYIGVTITMSPRGIPYSYRHMHGFGSHTYSFINAENQRIWVKFHLRTLQGIKNLTDQEAEAIVAKDRESHQRDLFESIEKGDYPKWLFQIQLMTEEEADNYRINPFDLD